jgi:hypothetical protein
MKKPFFIFLVLLVSLPATGQDNIPTGTAWSRPFFTRIDATFSSGEFHARWDISRCACGDLHLRAEETLPSEIRTGVQILLDNQALLVRGYESHEGELSALLDSPVLMMQLLLTLLQKSVPSGPSALTSAMEPDLVEPSLPLLLDSGVAFGQFPPPWSLAGSITPAPDNRIRYELRFEFNVQGADLSVQREHINLSGYLDFMEKPFPVNGSALVDGWSLDWIGQEQEARPVLKPGMTLGEFRALIETPPDPG